MSMPKEPLDFKIPSLEHTDTVYYESPTENQIDFGQAFGQLTKGELSVRMRAYRNAYAACRRILKRWQEDEKGGQVSNEISFEAALIKAKDEGGFLAETASHVVDDYWIYEGMLEVAEVALSEIRVIVRKGSVPSLGGLTENELIAGCQKWFGVPEFGEGIDFAVITCKCDECGAFFEAMGPRKPTAFCKACSVGPNQHQAGEENKKWKDG